MFDTAPTGDFQQGSQPTRKQELRIECCTTGNALPCICGALSSMPLALEVERGRQEGRTADVGVVGQPHARLRQVDLLQRLRFAPYCCLQACKKLLLINKELAR